MLFFVIMITLTKIINKWRKEKKIRIQKEIALKYEEVMSEPSSDLKKEKIKRLHLPKHLVDFRELVEVTEQFDHRFSDKNWQLLKETVIDKYLLKMANKYAFGSFWFPRQLAGRCYLLSPRKAPIESLDHLLADSRFLIRIVAALAIIKTPYKELFGKVIQRMSEESDLTQFTYRDAIIESDQEKFEWIQEILLKTRDMKVINICIDLLSTRTWYDLPNLVEKYLYSENHKTRILSIRALGSVASEKSVILLKKHLQDSDWEIRAESIMALNRLYVTSLANEIEPLLNDPSWWVRQQAAIALKNFGPKGIEILMSQSSEKTPQAYEISQYILAMP